MCLNFKKYYLSSFFLKGPNIADLIKFKIFFENICLLFLIFVTTVLIRCEFSLLYFLVLE